MLAGTDHVRLMQRAGHTNFTTTLGYIRQVEDAGFDLGAPLPPLPDSLIVAADNGPVASRDRESSSKKARKVASPTGFEPYRGDFENNRRHATLARMTSKSLRKVRSRWCRVVPSDSVEKRGVTAT